MTDQFDLNKLNSFLNAASKTISCGPDCQRNNKSQELKQKYIDAENNLALAEPQYQTAKKNYYSYVSGKNEYDNIVENELNKEANIIVVLFKNFMDKEINKINTQIESYHGLSINLNNIKDLLEQYKTENQRLQKEIKEETNDILTNERKTYYKNQEIDQLKKLYSYIFLIIYVIVVFCFVVFSLVYPSQTTFKMRVVLFFFFIILPFISTWLLDKFIYFMYWLYSLLPKNANT
jgi:hypothetical protein